MNQHIKGEGETPITIRKPIGQVYSSMNYLNTCPCGVVVRMTPYFFVEEGTYKPNGAILGEDNYRFIGFCVCGNVYLPVRKHIK